MKSTLTVAIVLAAVWSSANGAAFPQHRNLPNANMFPREPLDANAAMITMIPDGQMQVGRPATSLGSGAGQPPTPPAPYGSGNGGTGNGGTGGGQGNQGQGCSGNGGSSCGGAPPPPPPPSAYTSSTKSICTKSHGSPLPPPPPASPSTSPCTTSAPPASPPVYQPSTKTVKTTSWLTVTSCTSFAPGVSPTCYASSHPPPTHSTPPKSPPSNSPPPSSCQSCHGSGQSPPPAPPNTCPLDLNGKQYTYPHSIIIIDQNKPNEVTGTGYMGSCSASGKSTAFRFDIPSEWAGQTCTLTFALPNHHQLETSSFSAQGSMNMKFMEMGGSQMGYSTSYSDLTEGGVKSEMASMTMNVGSLGTVISGPCKAGQQMTVMMSMQGSDANAKLDWFQDYNPCPIGLFMVAN